MDAAALGKSLESRKARTVLESLYGAKPGVMDRQVCRYRDLLDRFQAAFPGVDGACMFSTPGRTEIGGNHTDHNGGRVLAAAVDLDAIAVAAPASDGLIVVESEGYPRHEVRLDDLGRAGNRSGPRRRP